MTLGSFFSACDAPLPPSGAGPCSCSLMLETPPVFARRSGAPMTRSAEAPFVHMRPCVSRSHFPTVSAGHFLVRQVQDARHCEAVVVQCPTWQSKVRIADDKVTDRGVRVRCTSCKNVFQVKKPGASGADAPGPGNTIEMSSLGAAAVAPRAGARPTASRPA